MTTLTFQVTGDYAHPTAFMAYLNRQLGSEEHCVLRITASRVDLDELASRRSEASATLEFDLFVDEVRYSAPPTVAGLRADTNEWVHLAISDENVRFDVMS